MKRIYKNLGRKGRITIPIEIREVVQWEYNDILSFSLSEDGQQVIIQKEKICEHCECAKAGVENVPSHFEFLDHLTGQELYDALVYMVVKWAEREACHEDKNLPD